MTGWTRAADQLPPDGMLVDALNPSGNLTQLRRRHNLWFLPDESMYVYFSPEWWRPAA